MDLFVLDFQKQFDRHLKEWMRKNREKYPKAEQMEAQVEKVYEHWLETPAVWLEGATPLTYFDRYDDPEVLVRWMLKYIAAGVWVPDPMLDRIVALGEPAQEPLLKIKRRETPLPSGERADEAVVLAIKLLNELGSTVPLEEYVQTIVEHPDSEYIENIVESLIGMGEQVVEPILAAMERPLDPQATEWFLSVLVEFQGHEKVFRHLMKAYESEEGDKAVLAAYLGKYGRAEAVPVLKDALKSGALNYLEWTETRNAIEELGEPVFMEEPDFSGDPWYESLRYLDN